MSGNQFVQALLQSRGSLDHSTELVRKVCARLGNPQDRVKTVHVAGTNGKGSTCVMIAAMLGAAGYRVGMTQSPHLHRVNERILIDGTPISDEKLYSLAAELEEVCSSLGVMPSLHEGFTILSFMASRELDWLVVEVGLGGRLDSSNVIRKPEVAVITSISLDHTHILGNTESAIAREKAGIIKAGAPTVIGQLGGEALASVEEMAREKRSSLRMLGRDFELLSRGNPQTSPDIGTLRADEPENSRESTYSLGLLGEYQQANGALAVEVAKLCGLDADAIESGLKNAHWPARLEWTKGQAGRSVLFDCAHNPAGIAELVNYLQKLDKPVDFCFASLSTKDWKGMVDVLSPLVARWFVLEPPSGKAVAAETIVSYLKGKNASVIAEGIGTDYQRAATLSGFNADKSPLVVAGSMYMVAEVRALIVHSDKYYWKRGG